jgi:hypothetical protein
VIAKSAIIQRPRTRRLQPVVLRSRSSASAAASTQDIKKLSKQLANSNWQLASEVTESDEFAGQARQRLIANG